MLRGVAEPEAAAPGAPRIERFDASPLVLPGVRVLQMLYEIEAEQASDLLPPALHPTLPPAVSWLIYDCPDTPWGPMRLAQTRIECRSGTRPRGFLVSGVCTEARAASALAERWGYRLELGEISCRWGYDEVRCAVALGGETVLELALRDPSHLDPGNIQFVAGMHPAHTPQGFRLVQCDPTHAEIEAERGLPILEDFDGEAWGDERIEPAHPISGARCVADVTLPALRFVCKPGELAFTGTERVQA